MNDSVNYALQKWILSHPHIIQYPTTNDFIKEKLYDRNLGAKTKIHHEVLLKISVHKLHIDMLRMISTGFSMSYDETLIVLIKYSYI